MSDNIQLNAPTTSGARIATDEIDYVQHQLVKLEFGDDGIATKVSATNPLPVSITSDIQIGAMELKNATDDTRAVVTPQNALKVDGSATTQPISASALPLPTGAAIAANQQTDALTDAELRATPLTVDTGIVQYDAGDIYTTPKGTVSLGRDPNDNSLHPIATNGSGVTIITGSVVASIVGGGQENMNNSAPVVIASDQSAIPISATDLDVRNLVFATDKVDVSGSTIAIDTTGLATSAGQSAQATATKQDTGNTSLGSIDTKLPSGLTMVGDRLKVEIPSGASGLTDTQIRATPLPISGTVSTGLSQPLTDTQLRATPVQVNGTLVLNNAYTQDNAIKLPDEFAGIPMMGYDAVNDHLRFVKVDDNGVVAVSASINTAGLATEAKQNDEIALLNSVIKTEDTIHSTGDKGIMALGVNNIDFSILSSNTGDYTPIATNQRGVVYVGTMEDNYLGVNVQNSVQINDADGSITVDAVSLPLPTGAATETTLAAVNTKLPSGLAVAGGRLQVELPSGSGGLTDTQIRATALPVSLSATTITGSVAVTGALTDAQLRATDVKVSLDGEVVPVTGTFFQATQPISASALPLPSGAAIESGNLASIKTNTDKIPALGQALAAASTPVVLTAAQISTLTPQTNAITDAQIRATPLPISGTVTTGGLTDTQIRATALPVSLSATTITGSVAVTGALTDAQLRATDVKVSLDGEVVPVTGTFFQATQPISASALPLPSGAAIESGNLASIKTNTDKIPALGQALAAASTPVVLTAAQISTLTPQTNAITDAQIRATPLPISGTVTTGGLTDTQIRATALPVSGTVSANATLSAETTKVIGTVNIAATQAVTANAGTNLNTSALSLETTQNAIKTAVEILDNAISGSEMQVDVVAPLPAGTNNIGGVDVLTLPTISLAASSNNIGDVDIVSSVLPTGASTETTLSAINTKTPSLGQAVMASSQPVVIASNQSTIPVSFTAASVLFKGRASTFRTLGRAGTAGQNIMSIHNATGSAINLVVKKVTVDLYQTVVKAVTVAPPIIRMWKVTVLPTNGTALAKTKIGGTTTSSASVTVLGDASADGTGSATTLTTTRPAGTFISQEYAPRLITAAGYEMSDRLEFFDGTEIVLGALEGIVVFLDYTLATQNPITDMWIAGLEWEERTP